MVALLLVKKIFITTATVSMFRVAPGTDISVAANTNSGKQPKPALVSPTGGLSQGVKETRKPGVLIRNADRTSDSAARTRGVASLQ